MENKNVIVISTSLRKGGNSDLLADAFVKGAMEKGNHVEKISLVSQDIHFCKVLYVKKELNASSKMMQMRLSIR